MDYKKMDCDVLVIGAGGAGMRAALAASEMGAKVIMVSKSLLGKAHTVMAEGGALPLRWATSIQTTTGRCTSQT